MKKRIISFGIVFAMVLGLVQPITAQAQTNKNTVLSVEDQIIAFGASDEEEETPGSSFESAIELSTGSIAIEGVTYAKYVNQTQDNVALTLYSSDYSDDPFLDVYKLGSGDLEGTYVWYDDNDDGGDGLNFRYTAELAAGEAIYFKISDLDTAYFDLTLNVSWMVIKDIASVKSIAANPLMQMEAYIELIDDDIYLDLSGLKLNVQYTDGTYGEVLYNSYGSWGYDASKVKLQPGTYPVNVYFTYLSKTYTVTLNYTLKSIISSSKAISATINTEYNTVYKKDGWTVYELVIPTTGYYNLFCLTNSGVDFVLYDNYNKSRVITPYFSYDGIHSANYITAGTYYMLVNVNNSGKSAKWRLAPGSDANQEGITVQNIQVQPYTGKAIEPEPILYYKGKDVTKYEDGYVWYSYYNNVNAGIATLRIGYEFYSPEGDWIEDYYYTTFRICKPIDKASVTVSNVTYTGTIVVPAATVKLDGIQLVAGKDYKVIPDSNVNAGVKTVTIEGIGAYSGKITKSYNMLKANQTINVAGEFIKNKSSKKFSLNAKAAGALSYKTSAKKIATVNSKGKVTLKKQYGTANITITAAGTQNYNAATKVVKVIVTSKASKVTSLKSTSKKQMKVKVAKATGANGYEISYSTDKKFLTGVKTKTIKGTSVTIKNLKSKKKYYVRVRSYRKVKGKKLYSEYSKAKSVKVK